jgi:hypothetical protein
MSTKLNDAQNASVGMTIGIIEVSFVVVVCVCVCVLYLFCRFYCIRESHVSEFILLLLAGEMPTTWDFFQMGK